MLVQKSKTKSVVLTPKTVQKSSSFFPKKFFWAVFFCVLIAAASIGVFLIFDENGKADISEERKEALQKALEKLENAEQYVLTAKKSKFYPCSNGECATIWLNMGEVYRYGTTINGQKGRGYLESYLTMHNLDYFIEFKGSLQECLKQEKTKIYYYPTLAENLNRPLEIRLNRPPANPQDR